MYMFNMQEIQSASSLKYNIPLEQPSTSDISQVSLNYLQQDKETYASNHLYHQGLIQATIKLRGRKLGMKFL